MPTRKYYIGDKFVYNDNSYWEYIGNAFWVAKDVNHELCRPHPEEINTLDQHNNCLSGACCFVGSKIRGFVSVIRAWKT
jgi:hypothetical protein